MRHSLRRISIAASIVSATLFAILPTSATAAPESAGGVTTPATVATPAPVPTGGSASTDDIGSTATSPAGLFCSFTTNGDFVHISSSAFEASGHGWWVNGDCDTATAVVTVQLQEFFSDGTWRNKGTVGRATVRSGGGAGNRATGRASCSNGSVTGWRSVIDVDLVGLADDPGKLTTSTRNIGCRQ